MSKINDALKRAKDAQGLHPAAAPDSELQPLAPLSPSPRGIGLVLPTFIVLFVFMSFLFVWQTRQQVSASQPKTKAPSTPATASPAPVAQPLPAIAANKAPAIPKAATPAKPITASNTLAAALVVTPEPTPKLQAIFYSPGRSTAIIDGKTVRTGDALRNFRVATITPTSATIFSYTQTNVLVLK